jgi:hypothetical protein
MATDPSNVIEDLMKQLSAARIETESLRGEQDYFMGKSAALEDKNKGPQTSGIETSGVGGDRQPRTEHENESEFEETFDTTFGRGGFRTRGRGPFRGNFGRFHEERQHYEDRDVTRDDVDFKMDLPLFEGKHDSEAFVDWLQVCERNFELKEKG